MSGGFEPFRRRGIRVLNHVGAELVRRGLGPHLSADALRRRAEKSATRAWEADALTDEALDVLTRSIVDEANLSYFGALVIRARLHGLLTTRLRVAALLEAEPE
ncbi:MAG: sulfotransferase, partial [Gordonia polyisoprenivorans]|nr:sulfotransferase [Gordonia polyisoprenivorans]